MTIRELIRFLVEYDADLEVRAEGNTISGFTAIPEGIDLKVEKTIGEDSDSTPEKKSAKVEVKPVKAEVKPEEKPVKAEVKTAPKAKEEKSETKVEKKNAKG